MNFCHISDCMLILPSEFEEDGHLKPLMDQLMEMLRQEKAKVSIKVKAGDTISHKDGVVIIPCINNTKHTKLDEIVGKSVDAANLGKCYWKLTNSQFCLSIL